MNQNTLYRVLYIQYKIYKVKYSEQMLEKLSTILLIIIELRITLSTGCTGSTGFWNCGHGGSSTCYQYNDGSFWSCGNPSGSYGQYQLSNNAGTYSWCTNYDYCCGCNMWGCGTWCCCSTDSQYINMAVYRKCSWECLTCNAQSNPDSGCQSCRGGYYLWSGWGRCYTYCPTYAITAARTWYGTNSVGQYKISSTNQCQVCNFRCNFCDGPSNQDCYSCVNNYYLIDDTASTCTTRFSTVGYGPQYSCYYDQCFPTANTCPTFYFYVAASTVNSTEPYYTWGIGRQVPNNHDANFYNRRYNDDGVCYFCDKHCQTCNGPLQTNCLTCKRFNYYWNQRSNYCQETCPRGDYEYSTGWRGEWINETAIVTSTGVGDRTCKLCNLECRWCRGSASRCLQCRRGYFLLDLYQKCMQRYITPNNCSVCTSSTYDTCRHASYITNKQCRSSCPPYFYFRLYRSAWAPEWNQNVLNPRYDNFTNITAASQSYINGTDNDFATPQAYRRDTNLCMLCDYRCVQCTGPLNVNCTMCRNGFYLWTNNTVCDDHCPIGQYIARNLAHPRNQTQCADCDSNCLTCQMTSINCSSCVGYNYSFWPSNDTVAFLQTYNESYAKCLNTCQKLLAPDYQTRIGFYGSYLTLACYPCPSPCSNCNLQLIRDQYPDVNCGTDIFCSSGIICETCLTGYVVVAGKCISEANCRQYAYYVEPAVSAPWSAANCKCMDGYTSTMYAKCDKRCHITCLTCSGTAINNCLTCYTGSTLISGRCDNLDSAKAVNIAAWYIGSSWSGTAYSSSVTSSCGGFSTLFGFQDQDDIIATNTDTNNKYFGYSFSISSLNYYAIRIKIGFLFVDEYHPRGVFYLSRDSTTTTPVWSWNYNMNGSYGEQLCGSNKMDYIAFITAEIPTRNVTTQTFYLTSNEDLLENSLGYQLHWGFHGFFITVLQCHADCSRCTGPSNTQCLSCSATGHIAVNGTCVCNIAANYYYWPGTPPYCNLGCPANDGWFRDDATRSCVQPPTTSNCTAPKRFGNSLGTTGYGDCVIDCPSTFYASMKIMKCTTDCWTGLSQYKFDGGGSRTCQNPCPVGYIKDILNRACVLKCPSTYYYQIQNSTTDATCTATCPTGWEYDGLQLCVTECPSGYFRQTLSGHNKCVSICTNAFGDPDSGNCTTSCPFPKYADPSNRLCVDTCSASYPYMQVKVSNLNRTCETVCESVQWANPFTKKCSNYTTDCPDGYYADSLTRFCVANCTQPGYVAENTTKSCRTSCLTGFAHWENRVCVQICPSDPSMFGYIANKSCVYNCDHTNTLLYGDAQANRTCVQRCSSSPQPTFGRNSTSLCVDKCPGSTQFGDPGDVYRRCVQKCSGLPRRYADPILKQCVLNCSDSYYGQIDLTLNSGVCVQTCNSGNFGDPETNWCRPTCRWGYYGYPVGSRPCVVTCPRYWFGMNGTTNRLCVSQCDPGYWGDIQTSMCYNVKTSCSNDTYADAAKFLCVKAPNCTQTTFADPFTKGCQSTCSNNYFADNNINTCVSMCSQSLDEYGQWGICRYTCILSRFADAQANRTCVRFCSRTPVPLFGLIATRRICVTAPNCPTDYYGDNTTILCVKPCPSALPFGDPISKMCVIDCPDGYYGDRLANLCVRRCNWTTLHYADNRTGNCQTNCSLGTYGVNATTTDTIPSCQQECPPNSFARDSDRICVSDCGAGLYGDPITRKCYSSPFSCSEGYFANSVSHLCVLPANCQTVGLVHYFAQNSTKTCVPECLSPNYGDTRYWFCYPVCNETSYGENTTRLCKTDCTPWSSYAQNQNNLCVSRCSNTPIMHYAEDVNHRCVQAKDCPVDTTQTYAQNSTQKCVRFCGTNEWADPTRFRCVVTCPNGYFADDSTGQNICSTSCPGDFRYRDNSTRKCVSICPASNQTFGDKDGDACVYRCPDTTFAQNDTNRRCVSRCNTTTWGNKITRICISNPVTGCPANTWADNFTQKCQEVCDASSNYYGYNVTKMCVTSCISPTFAWDGSRVCIDICPSSLVNSGYFGDPMTTPTRKCFLTCQTTGYYRDIAASRTCVQSCTYNTTYKTYKDPTTMSCEAVCSNYPQFLYADDNLKSCQASCAGTLRKNDATQKCVSTCPYLYDPTTDKCVDICPTQSSSGALFANLTANNNTCIIGSSCPANTYADTDSRTCTSSCPNGTYINGKFCVYFCPGDYFMDPITRACVTPFNCSSGRIADNQTRSCVTQCIGTFAQSTLNRCIDVCYGSKYGDPFTHKCEVNCSQGLKKNAANNSCEADCIIGLYANPATGSCSSSCSSPYYADNNTMSCVTSCSANPMTFASVSASGVRQCVGRCETSKMHDMINRICVATNACPSNTYSYTVNMSCVAFCPGPSYYQLGTACVTNCSSHATLKYADDLTRTCVSVCPSGSYKDSLSFKCVTACPTAPSQYYIAQSWNNCTTLCPQGTYADPQQLRCVSNCSLSPPMYAEQVNNVCVQSCPLSTSTFADPTTMKCVTNCPSGYFADSRDRTCKQNCSFLFSDSTITPRACVANCSVNLYANQLTYQCLQTCPINYYKHTPAKLCVRSCPFGYFLNRALSLCVIRANCPSTAPFADNLTRTCTNACSNGQFGYLASGTTTGGQCRFYCPNGTFSNPWTGLCAGSCPDGLYAQTDNNTCMLECTYDKFMDWFNNRCTTRCPSANNLYANIYNRTCVTQCDPATFTFADDLTRACEETCTGNQYADNATLKCVGPASCSNGLFSDPNLKQCVEVCYNGTFGYLGRCIPDCPTSTDDVYSSHQGSICVSATNCPNGTYGDPILHQCVEFCPIESGTFADDATKKCLPTCNSPLFADNLTRTCVQTCPNISKMYGHEGSHRCVLFCPYPLFADETTNLCKDDCPNGYFADSSTLTCVQKCPQGKYGNNQTNQCVDTCPQTPLPYFGNPDTRECILYCPEGKYADIDNNRECHPKCTANVNTYAENSTNQCLGTCLTGFANERTKQCIGVCTAGYYGYNGVCYQDCPSVSPSVFADNQTHLCVEQCPNNTFADYSTLRCVLICPIEDGTFGNVNNWVCTDDCPGGQFADESTRLCVRTCPSYPALFGRLPQKICVSECVFGKYADNQTRMCADGCPNGTYADNTTMKCEFSCPRGMFGQNITNKCVKICSAGRQLYGDNATGTCVYYCTNGTFAFYNTTFRGCLETCPANYYAVNRTGKCQPGCQAGTFADRLLRICVARCSIDPIFYGDPLDNFCKTQCPGSSFGNPLSQQCVYDSSAISTCPPQYYGDPTTKLCVEVCPKKHNIYADPYFKKCRSACSNGLIADNSTMKCVPRCPDYPSYFAANLDILRCIPFCPSGTYADLITRTCVPQCPNNTYGDNSTWRCVSKCPQQPLTFADDSTWTCVLSCPNGTYADNSTLTCAPRCPYVEGTFADNGTNACVRVCPQFSYGDQLSGYCVLQCYNGTFSENSTRLCVPQCPRYPPTYADPTTNQCVNVCPDFYFAFQDNRTCVSDCPGLQLYKQNSTWTCVSRCSYSDDSYADNLTGYCVLRCSEDSWADPTIRVCVAVCPDQPLMYADNTTQSCVVRCPGLTFGQNTTRTCVDACPNGSLSLPQKNLCVRYCPIGYFAYNSTQFCVDQCPGVYYGDPSTRSCVLTCPLSQLLYADNSSKQCVRICPPGSYADKKSVQCVSVCPDANTTLQQAQTYAADYNNKCVQECALPYFAYLPTKRCLSYCPNPYYNNVPDHTCKLCRSVCISCTTYDTCTSCISSFFLQNGLCVSQCSDGYYANLTSMRCVSSTLCRPYYGVNSTHQCSSSCPVGSYANRNVYRCDACQSQCITCTSWTYCLTCNTNVSVLYQNFCYLFCQINDTDSDGVVEQLYSVNNQTCYQNCPAGTFLFLIFCRNCSSQCETCSILSTNCTRCANGLYLQNQVCVSSCSTGYKPTTTRNCVYCGSSCGNSLTFNTNITQINGQNTIFVTFSDNVSINGDPNTIFSLQTTSRRRLLASGYQIVIVDQKTIKIIIDNSIDASQFTVVINEPQKIQDMYGNLPASVRAQIQVDLANTYSTTLQTASSNFSNYFAFLAAVCVISFLFDIQFMKFMQLLYVHYFVVMILPPELSKVLLAFRSSTLNYLPTMFEVPQAILRVTVSGKIYDAIGDYSFLRNSGFVLTPLAVILFMWILIKILSIPEINKFKGIRMWCKDQLDEKFTFAVQIQWLSIMYINTIFFIFMQMKDYNQYDSFSLASIVIAHILLGFIGIFFLYLVYRVINFFRQHPKLSQNLKKATQLLLQENQYHKLNSSNIFLFEMKKIDLRNLYYPKINNENILPFRNIYKFSFLPLCCILVTYLRATILSIILVFGSNTLLQLSLCIALNVLTLLYFSRARPFSFKFKKRKIRNYFAIYHQVALIIFQLLMLALGILDRDMKTALQKQMFSKYIIYYLCAVCTVSFMYFLFRVGVQIYRRIYLPFTETQVFRVNFPEKYAQLYGNKKDKLLKGVDPKAKEALRALIKGYKKNRSSLRPNEEDKANPQLPMKYKITYFDKDATSSIDSKSSMSKAQKRKMIKQIFGGEDSESLKQSKVDMAEFEEVAAASEKTEAEYEQYEEQIEIKAKDLAKYVKNAEQLLRIKKMKEEKQDA